MESADASTLAAAVLGRFSAAIEAASRPFVLGISGLQGSGKSTLADALIECAGVRGWASVTMSLDDVYLTRADRESLAARVHPLLRTRGVPGTHDLALLTSTLSALEKATARKPVPVPRFDKGRDERCPRERWPLIADVPKLIVLEGWCLGVDPADATALIDPVNALERDEDGDGTWRRWVNAQLAAYVPVWKRVDALVVLQAPSWDVVARWRDEAEQPLRKRGEPCAMDAAEMTRFLRHYERISRRALATLPAKADVLLALDENRGVARR